MVECRSLLMVAIFVSGSVLSADDAPYVNFGPASNPGKSLWLENCEGCHGYGIAGAPIPMRPKDWVLRVAKPRETLIANAINGFFGPGDTYMPPRGGNPQLSDRQVQMAVDYMLTLANHYLTTQQEETQ